MDKEILSRCARAQSDVYVDPGFLPEKPFSVFNRNQIQAFAWAYHQDILIAVRGTDELKDWIRNIPIRQEVFGTTFISGYVSAVEELVPWFRKVISGKKAILTGHSQGGGIVGTLTALYPQCHADILNVVTFGCPQYIIGPHPFADRIINVVRRLDIVPDLPIGWQRPGKELYFTDDGMPCKRSFLDAFARRWTRYTELRSFG